MFISAGYVGELLYRLFDAYAADPICLRESVAHLQKVVPPTLTSEIVERPSKEAAVKEYVTRFAR